MQEMKISRLVKYLKETWFKHIIHTNIDICIKHKIYESYAEKIKNMSKNKFCSYLTSFWLSKTVIKEIIKVWDKYKDNSLEYIFWKEYEKNNYKNRYINTSRTKKIDQLNDNQTKYLIKLRENEPNKWYKLFENWLFIPENKNKFEKIFWVNMSVSKRLFYEVIKKYNIPHRITKRSKIWLLAEHKKNNTLETYIAEQHHVYAWYKALHKWQVDIKYLSDIPNYVSLWIINIYLYEITFRDYKSWLTICFFWSDRSKSSVLIAFEMFKKLMNNIWINLKEISFQFDWWAEFSNIRINNIKWVLIEMIERDFKWFRLINKKEQNWHVETFHRRIEEDLFDTKYISKLKNKLDNWKITKQDLKKEILKLLNTYILNFNNYWYSSYKPRYELFWKKSPVNIVKEELKNEIDKWIVNINFLEKYLWAYDVSSCYNLMRVRDYSSIINSVILLKENKFDLAAKEITLTNNNYLDEFYDFLYSNKSGRIWNGTIDLLFKNILTYIFFEYNLVTFYIKDSRQM